MKDTEETASPAAKMDMCRWLDPFLVVRIEFLEWTPENRLRHARFAGIRSDKDARDVTRDGTAQRPFHEVDLYPK
jgi:ATP-dependent DNA ligase